MFVCTIVFNFSISSNCVHGFTYTQNEHMMLRTNSTVILSKNSLEKAYLHIYAVFRGIYIKIQVWTSRLDFEAQIWCLINVLDLSVGLFTWSIRSYHDISFISKPTKQFILCYNCPIYSVKKHILAKITENYDCQHPIPRNLDKKTKFCT